MSGTITGELRELLADINWTEIIDHMRLDHGAIVDGDWLDSWHAAADNACDAIDAVHANLERENESLRRELDRVLGEQEDERHTAGESITGELRAVAVKTECASGRCEKLYRGDLERIADRIDAEHERIVRETGKEIVRDVRREWVRLPVDADGVPWHIGDVTESGQEVKAMGLNRHGWSFVGIVNEIDPAIHRHYATTVEDVLREFAQAMNENMGLYTGEAIDADEWRSADAKTIAKFAAKLRLAGDAS